MEPTPSKTLKAVGVTMDWSHFLIGILAALSGVVIALMGGLKELALAWLERWTHSARESMASEIGRMAAFLEAIEAIEAIRNVDRVLVMRGKNGGGRPVAGRIYTTKAIHGWAKDKTRDPMHRYDFDLPVDSHYCRWLEKMITDGAYELETATMPPDAKLRTYYTSEGVIQSRMYFLRIIGDELIYMSVATFDGKFSDDDRTEIDLAANRVVASLSWNR